MLSYPGEPGTTSVLRKERDLATEKKEGDMGLEAEVGAMCFEDGGKATNHGMQVASRN